MTKFPNIIKAIRGAKKIELPQPGNKTYCFRTFAFGERGTKISYELLKEITGGLVDSIKNNFDEFDYIVSPAPGGHTWGSLVALQLGKHINILRSEPSYEDTEHEVTRKTGYYQHNLFFNHFNGGDRVVVLDDVVSTGGTLETILDTFHQLRVIPIGVQVIFAKSEDYKKIEKKYGVAVKALVKNSEII